MGSSHVVALVGNPRSGSRTARAAEHLARLLSAAIRSDAPVTTVDLSAYGPAVLDPRAADVDSAVDTVRSADLLVVASPVYKGTFTGLLKSFLDRMPPEALRGTVCVPLMVGASDAHSSAPEASLRPVLVELSAICPTPALYLKEAVLGELGSDTDPALRWYDRHARTLSSVIDALPVRT
ncbi:NAD(P)H-dependent oxidoreductase [Nocardiopsis sp. NPDC049922]|uniref:NADPH-dependent FMN reductase n=1 Tax=Nocardiopsis sp. NPDC049922 TaxID=3155157 RepID=UPI0033EB1BDE